MPAPHGRGCLSCCLVTLGSLWSLSPILCILRESTVPVPVVTGLGRWCQSQSWPLGHLPPAAQAGVQGANSCLPPPLPHPWGAGWGERGQLFLSSALKRVYEPFRECIKAIAPGTGLILGDFHFPLFLDLRVEPCGLLKSPKPMLILSADTGPDPQ